MDLFNRGKSKGKKKNEPIVTASITPPFTTTPHSPKSPVLHPTDDYFASGMSISYKQKYIFESIIFINPVQG